MMGEISAPTPKKKWSAFIYGPTFAPCTQPIMALPPTSTMASAMPVMSRTPDSSQKTPSVGTSAMQSAMTASMTASNMCPATRSYSRPPSNDPMK